MRSIESDLILALKDKLEGVTVYADYVPEKPTIPFVHVYEGDNYESLRHRDTRDGEAVTNVMYVIEAYTSGDTRRSSSREMLGKINSVARKLGLLRISTVPIIDRDYFRVVVRYRCAITDSGTHKI